MAIYSLSEIDALTRKATRGASYNWGIAEEVGKAMRWLSAYGFAGPEILAKHLEIVDDKPRNFIPDTKHSVDENVFGNNDKPICSLYCGTLINDLGHHLTKGKTLSFNNVLSPLLVLPSAARIAEAYNISVSILLDQTEVICNPNGIVLKDSSVELVEDTPPLLKENSFSSSKNDLAIYSEPSTFASNSKINIVCSRVEGSFKSTHFPSPQGREITDDALAILEKYAHKTYAPATEESRMRGAG